MICPDCKRRLKADASVCLCGWGMSTPTHIDCFNAPHCTRPAVISTDRYQEKGYFQNFCIPCEKKAHEDKADKWCKENGLITTQQKIDFCRAMAKKMFRGVKFLPDRVPGEDDELAA